MPFYIQYNNAGQIIGVVQSDEAPVCANQIESEVYIDSMNKKVDVETRQIIDASSDIPVETIIYEKIRSASDFGTVLITKYGVKNVMRGLTNAEVISLSNTLATVSNLLRSGALLSAKQEIEALQITSLVTQEDKNEFVAAIDAYLLAQG